MEELGLTLEKLYYPYAERIIHKLEYLFPSLAENYRQRKGTKVSLETLRYQVHMLRSDNFQDKYVSYRLFDFLYRTVEI